MLTLISLYNDLFCIKLSCNTDKTLELMMRYTKEVYDLLLQPKKINALLLEEFKVNSTALKKEYPLGYALYYTDGKEVFASKSTSELIDVE